MSNVKFSPSLAILALAGNAAARIECAFDALLAGITAIVGHGDKRTLSDTMAALAGLKGAQARMVEAFTQRAYDAACLKINAHKGDKAGALACAEALTTAAANEYETACTAAAEKRATTAAANKAAKAKAAKAIEKAAKAIEKPTLRPLTIADCAAFLNAACAAQDDAALSAVEALAEAFLEAVAVA
jgi:hypothetical protein